MKKVISLIAFVVLLTSCEEKIVEVQEAPVVSTTPAVSPTSGTTTPPATTPPATTPPATTPPATTPPATTPPATTPPANTLIGGFETKGKTLLLSGSFVRSGSYTVSGKAYIYEETDKSKVLVIEDLKSSAGPDLRIYLAADKAASNSIEIFNKVENGSKNFKIPASADLTKQKTVLIWCKAFSVTFGSAELK